MALEIIESPKVKQPLSSKGRFVFASICSALGILVFTLAYVGMGHKAGLGVYNQSVLSWMLKHRSSDITNVAKIVTMAASLQFLAVTVGVVAIIWGFLRREVWRPLALVVATSVAAAVSMVLKNLTMDARPPQTDMIPAFETSFSFPSGHTISIAVFLLVFGYLIYSRHFSALRFISWMTIAIIGTGLIALSRLYLGYHWLTDVAASVGLAFIILAIVIVIDAIFVHRSKT